MARLSPDELEASVLHFAEGRSQAQIADWLGASLRTVQLRIQAAIGKVPQLRPLRTQTQSKAKRPRILHLSQLTRFNGREPFNVDEI